MRGAAPRIAVVGLGAIGGAIASALADAGRPIVGCVRTLPPQFVVHHPGGTSRPDFEILTDPGQADVVDWVLIATKAHHLAGIDGWLEALVAPETRIAVLQNGVDHLERLAQHCPAASHAAAAVPVVVQLPAARVAPGEIRVGLDGVLLVPDNEHGRDFAGLFENARTRVQPSDDFITQAWWKLLANAAMGGVCALAAAPNRYVLEPDAHAITLELMAEIVAVGRAEGARLPDDAGERSIQLMTGAAGDHQSSIVVDRLARRPMEWDARNAVVGRLGRRHGIPTPLNDAVTHLLQAIDATFHER